MFSRKKELSPLPVFGLSSSPSENTSSGNSSSDAKSFICPWYDAGAEGDVIDLACNPGRDDTGGPTLKAPGFIVFGNPSRDIIGGLSVKPFWNEDVLFEAWCNIGRIC
jgi:hypothetical protein